MNCKPTFLSSGFTMAVFQSSWKSLSLNNKLTILVMYGSTAGNICIRMCVGMGCDSHDFVFML